MRGLIACLGTAGVLLALAATGAARGRPALVVTHFAPVTVAGTGFAPDERVVVTVVAAGVKRARAVRAGARGGFRVRFEVRAPLDCRRTLAVSARGASGSTATAQLPRPRCPRDVPAP